MKIGKMALAAAVAMLLSGATASAQQGAPLGLYPQSPFSGVNESRSFKQVGYLTQPGGNREFDDKADEKAEDKPVGETTAPAGEECPSCYSEKYEPVRLFNRTPFEKKWGLQSGGWLAQSYVQNFYSPRNRFNGPVTWTDRSNDYQLNELYSFIGRPTDNGGEGWDIGFRNDVMYGTSSRFTTSANWEDRFGVNVNQSPFYNVAWTQLYMEAAYNDLKVKVGKFYSPVGFYVVGTYNNFFNTLPYTFQYGEPFTHTGALAQYQITDDINIGAGFTRGWDNSGAFNPNLGYLGTFTWNNLAKKGDSLAIVHVWSNEPSNTAADPAAPGGAVNPQAGYAPLFTNRFLQTLVYSRPINDKTTYVAQSDFGVQANALGDGRAAHWYGLNQYLYYKVNNCWSWGVNAEWFRDDLGFRVGGFLPNYTSGQVNSVIRGLPTTMSGFAGNFFQITCGPRWTPNPNLVIRPNMRWDWYNGDRNANGFTPYGDGQQFQQGILGTDVILVF